MSYICKIATLEEMNKKWDYEINKAKDKSNWIIWKKDNIERFKNKYIIPYYGLLDGKIIANEILAKYNYPQDKKEKGLNCIYNHRSSKNTTTIEEMCVADGDILAHFDNISMLFNSAFNRNNIKLNEVRTWMKECLKKDYNDLSDRTKETLKEKYKLILKIVLGEE